MIPKKIDFKYNLKIYWNLVKKYKLTASILMLLVIILQITYIADKFLFKIITDKGALFIEKTLPKNQFLEILIFVAAVYIGIVIIRVIGDWFQMHFLVKLETTTMTDMKRKFMNHIISLSHEFHTTHKTGSIISKIIRGSRAVERMTDTIIWNFSPLLIQLGVAVASLIYFDLLSAIIVFLTVIIFIIFGIFIQKIQQKANLFANETSDLEKGQISDFITNIDSIKYFGKEKSSDKKFTTISEKTKNAFRTHWNYFRWYGFGLQLIIGVGLFILIYFSAIKFLNNEISLGTLVFIYTIYGSIINVLFRFMHGIRDFYRIMADFESLFRYYKITNDIKDKPNAREMKITKPTIEFRNLTFHYPEKKRTIIHNFNLKIKQNEKVAIVGHSGSGKSTLIKLLYRLYEPTEGNIYIGNENINNFKQESLRESLSIVPQECMLFDDTIYNNIAFSNPKAKRKDVEQAIKFSQLDKIIRILPNGDKTIVGERGVKLSGGEKQRVSIARAILANKKILILDEATSSLDSETEHEIQKDLENLTKGRTSIIIAHRLSTIMNADRIIVMDKGKIVQIGTHNTLIRQRGQYKKLWQLQKGGYIE